MIIIATNKPTKPPCPSVDTNAVMLPTTSPIIALEPNNSPAKMPKPKRFTNTDDKPLTKSLAFFITISICYSYIDMTQDNSYVAYI